MKKIVLTVVVGLLLLAMAVAVPIAASNSGAAGSAEYEGTPSDVDTTGWSTRLCNS